MNVLRQFVATLVIMGLSLILTSCFLVPPPLTQVQIREMQTRTMQATDNMMVQKAVVNLLQDDGFIIKNAEPDLGLFVAEKQESIPYRPNPKKKPVVTPAKSTKPDSSTVRIDSSQVIIGVAGEKKPWNPYPVRQKPNEDVVVEDDAPPPIPAVRIISITVNVTTNNKSSVVRFSSQRSMLSTVGGIMSVEQIHDAEYYQLLHSRLDKSLFLQRTGF